jgi:hypothetical protein
MKLDHSKSNAKVASFQELTGEYVTTCRDSNDPRKFALFLKRNLQIVVVFGRIQESTLVFDQGDVVFSKFNEVCCVLAVVNYILNLVPRP